MRDVAVRSSVCIAFLHNRFTFATTIDGGERFVHAQLLPEVESEYAVNARTPRFDIAILKHPERMVRAEQCYSKCKTGPLASAHAESCSLRFS